MPPTIRLNVNGVWKTLVVDPEMPLLWVLRDKLELRGTKFGCGIGACGACTVHLDGRAVRSCIVPVRTAAGSSVRTIEGLGAENMHSVQQAWVRHQVPQCGYCQPGLIMAVAALLEEKPAATRDDLEDTITNICRCGTYHRIRTAFEELTGSRSSG